MLAPNWFGAILEVRGAHSQCRNQSRSNAFLELLPIAQVHIVEKASALVQLLLKVVLIKAAGNRQA